MTRQLDWNRLHLGRSVVFLKRSHATLPEKVPVGHTKGLTSPGLSSVFDRLLITVYCPGKNKYTFFILFLFYILYLWLRFKGRSLDEGVEFLRVRIWGLGVEGLRWQFRNLSNMQLSGQLAGLLSIDLIECSSNSILYHPKNTGLQFHFKLLNLSRCSFTLPKAWSRLSPPGECTSRKMQAEGSWLHCPHFVNTESVRMKPIGQFDSSSGIAITVFVLQDILWV